MAIPPTTARPLRQAPDAAAPSATASAPAPPERSRIALTWIMPVLDEEASLEAAVARVLRALERAADDFEVVIVDDGSTDRTGAIADRLAAADPRVRVLHNERNLNYGLALRRGIAAARCEWLLHDGADLPLAPEDLDAFTPYFHDSDVIVARRASRRAHPPWRRLTSWTHNRLVRLLFRPRASDLNFVQFYRRSFAASVELCSTSPAFTTPELILRAERTGLRVREVDAEFRRREAGAGHFGKLHDIVWTLKDMLKLRALTLVRGWRR